MSTDERTGREGQGLRAAEARVSEPEEPRCEAETPKPADTPAPTCVTCRYVRQHGYRLPAVSGADTKGYDLRCHIRSTPGPFPLRKRDDWCGEHMPNG